MKCCHVEHTLTDETLHLIKPLKPSQNVQFSSLSYVFYQMTVLEIDARPKNAIRWQNNGHESEIQQW